MEFFRSRLIDSLEQKHRKLARQAGFRMGRRTSEPDKPLPNDAKRKKTTGEQALDHTHFRQTCRRPEHLINGFFFSLLLKVGNTIDFMLKPEECKADIDKIMRVNATCCPSIESHANHAEFASPVAQ